MNLNLVEYIRHPEQLDSSTLSNLRAIVEKYPYYQTARLLYLRNLYQLCDPSFGEELSRTALHVTDRKAIYLLVEECQNSRQNGKNRDCSEEGSRTTTLISQFLSDLPQKSTKKKNVPVDVTVDYIGYLMQQEESENETNDSVPLLNGHDLIDSFIGRQYERITLKENPEYTPDIGQEDEKKDEEGYFTETLARIYIKQGRYEKAVEIIRKLSLNYPKKNRYFADQIRFLEKLIANKNNK